MALTPRQQKYKTNRLAGMNQYNAARAAGYSHNTAWKDGKRIENLAKLGMAAAFEQAGLTDKALVDFAKKGMYEATKLFGKDAVEAEDWQVRHKFFESICKMTDRLKEKHEITGKDGKSLMPPIIIYQGINANSPEADTVNLRSDQGADNISQAQRKV